MTSSRSRSQSCLTISLLVVCLFATSVQAEVPLRAFTANYTLEKGSLSVATAELSLDQQGKNWRWRLLTRARGIYAMFTRKRPFAEMMFRQSDNAVQLQSILISEGPDDSQPELARFDWPNGKMRVQRRGKQKVRQLPGSVHDYQSIHLVAADMQLRQQTERDLHFYRKGKIIDTKLTYLGEERIELNGETRQTRLYQQSFSRTDTVIRYYYSNRNPLLPLLIRRLEEDESPSVLTLTSVEWRS